MCESVWVCVYVCVRVYSKGDWEEARWKRRLVVQLASLVDTAHDDIWRFLLQSERTYHYLYPKCLDCWSRTAGKDKLSLLLS